MNRSKILSLILGALISLNANAEEPTNICLTGKVETTLPSYKIAILDAANLSLNQNPLKNKIALKTYFFDNKPLSALRAYNQMLADHCKAIIGFEYLSDLLLVGKTQSDTNIPIFTSYASSSNYDRLPKNIFIFSPSYEYQADTMIHFLNKKFGRINNALVVTEIDRADLSRYKSAYIHFLKQAKATFDTFDFIENDAQFERKLHEATEKNHYRFVFVFSGAVGSTKIINQMNDHKTIFIGTENFGSSTNQSVYARLREKQVNAFIIRNIDFLKLDSPLRRFEKEYFKRYSIMPSPLSAYTYDAVNIILKTLEEYKTVNTDDVLNINYQGITGISIRNGHFYRSAKLVILSIRDNGFAYEE